jgi:hypothetical protein
MAGCSRRRSDSENVALAIYASVCCGITVCLALGFYGLMQPTRIVNPGLAAYKPPPGAAMNLVGLMPSTPRPELITASIEPPAEAPDTSASQRETKKAAKAKPERPKRQQRAAHLTRWRDPMMSYAFQPSYFSRW